MMTFALAPSPKWYFLDATGKPAAGGFLYTYDNLDQTTPKFVFSDPAGQFPYTDPIQLDGTGGTPVPIYWDTTSPGLYYIVVTDAAGNIIFALNNFPISGSGGVTPVNTVNDIQNHIINGQFIFIDANSSADSIVSPIIEADIRIAPASGFFSNGNGGYDADVPGNAAGWRFVAHGGAGESSSIEFVDVTPIGMGNPASPSANATRFFRYTLSIPGAAQTIRALYQSTPDVETYSGELLTVSFDCRGSVGAIGVFEILQYYGTGGTPSASTNVTQNFNFTAGAWSRVSFQINVPSVVGKNKGTNNNDSIDIYWRFPINVLGTFDITNCQIQRGNYGNPPYVYQTQNQDQYKVLIDLITIGNLLFKTGELKWMSAISGGQPIDISGWIPLVNINQNYLGNAGSGAIYAGNTYRNLYIAWWDSFPDSECPVSGGRGASALSDFNAGKTIKIPKSILGAVLAGYGEGQFVNAPFGFFEGERTHMLTIPEMPSHNHNYSRTNPGVGTNFGSNPPAIFNVVSDVTSSTGGNIAHNNMQPTFYLLLYAKL